MAQAGGKSGRRFRRKILCCNRAKMLLRLNWIRIHWREYSFSGIWSRKLISFMKAGFPYRPMVIFMKEKRQKLLVKLNHASVEDML